MRASDIMILDTPRGDLVKILSSSYGLSLFSLKAGSHHDEHVGAAPRGSSSVSIGDFLHGVDQLDEAGPEGHSTIMAWSL
jgi:hypothetical protein